MPPAATRSSTRKISRRRHHRNPQPSAKNLWPVPASDQRSRSSQAGPRHRHRLTRIQLARSPADEEARHPGGLLRCAAVLGVAPRTRAPHPRLCRQSSGDLSLRRKVLPRPWSRCHFRRPSPSRLVATCNHARRLCCAISSRRCETLDHPDAWQPCQRGPHEPADHPRSGRPAWPRLRVFTSGRTHARPQLSAKPDGGTRKQIITLVPESLPALFHSRAGIIASGTATVEAAMMRTPFVMVYRVSRSLTCWANRESKSHASPWST